jgi:hypothetical protein
VCPGRDQRFQRADALDPAWRQVSSVDPPALDLHPLAETTDAARGAAQGMLLVLVERGRMVRNVLPSCLAIVTLCLMVGLPTVRADNYFLGDDFGLVQHLHDVPLERLLTYFYSDWTEGTYGVTYDELRPFLAFSYWLDSRLFGAANATGYHATNVALHTLNGLLVLAIARSVAPRQKAAALLAASFFVLMPSHAEPIAWISGRVDSLVALFYLAAFACFVRFRHVHRSRWLVAALVIFTCGLFAKQSFVTFPLLVLAYDFVHQPRPGGSAWRALGSRCTPLAPFLVILIGYLALRHELFGNMVREELITPNAFIEFAARQHSYLTNLMPVASDDSPSRKTWIPAFCIAVIAACGAHLAARTAESRPAIRRVIFFGVIWYAITIAPMIVTYESARHLYVSAAGFSIALATLILPERPSGEMRARSARVVVACALAFLYGMAVTRNVGRWIENGLKSEKLTAALTSVLRSVPRGSIVLVDFPAITGPGWFWSYALPFALQKPFVAEDLYSQYTIIERPEMYCCPTDQWWSRKQSTISSLWSAPAPREVTALFALSHDPELLRLTTREVGGPALRENLETALKKPVESLSNGLTESETRTVANVLLE